jgi:hypothetical protein
MADQWDLTKGFSDGLDSVFKPRERADAIFKQGQSIVEQAYKIDESQATQVSRLAEAERKRLEAEGALSFYNENPNAVKDSYADKYRYDTLNYADKNAALALKQQERDDAKTANDLASQFNEVVVTPEQRDENNNLVQAAVIRPTTQIEKLEKAIPIAPNYAVRSMVEKQLKVAYGNEAESALRGNDVVAAYSYAKKAGVISGNANLESDGNNGYVLKGTHFTQKLSLDEAKTMFFSRETQEKISVARQKAASDAAYLAQNNTFELAKTDNLYKNKQALVNQEAQIAAAQESQSSANKMTLAQENNKTKVETANIRSGNGGSDTSESTPQGATFGLAKPVASFADALKSSVPSANITSGKRDIPMGTAGAASKHLAGEAIDLRVNPDTYKYLTSVEGRTEMAKRGLGFLDESTADALKKTGGTGAHYHIGTDAELVKDNLAQLKKMTGRDYSPQQQVAADSQQNGIVVNGVVHQVAKNFLKSSVGIEKVPEFENYLSENYSQAQIDFMLTQGNTSQGNAMRQKALGEFAKKSKQYGATGSW